MTPHIESEKEQIAKTVLMPGDPLRASYIAENFLENAKLVNSVRGIYAYTGIYKGKEVTVMASGMGNPSMGIYSYELFKFYDVQNIIRIGTIGAYVDSVNLKDLVIAKESYSTSSFAKVQNNDDTSVIASSPYLNDRLCEVAKVMNLPVFLEKVYCSDVFYSDTEDFKKIVESHGCVGVEMETFALFHNAQILNKQATAILSVSNSFVNPKELTPQERQTSLSTMIVLALETAITL